MNSKYFLISSFIFMFLKKFERILRSLFIPVFGVPEIDTKSSAKNSAVITSVPILIPIFELYNFVPSEAIYRKKAMVINYKNLHLIKCKLQC